MNRQALTAAYDYFAAIQEISPEEESILELLKNELPYFQITAVSRDDLKKSGFNPDNITDDDLEELAKQMEDRYIPNSFWYDMEEIAKDMDFPILKNKDQ